MQRSPQRIPIRLIRGRPSIRWIITPQHPWRRLAGGLIIGALVAVFLAQALAVDGFASFRTNLQDRLYEPRPTAGITTIIAIDDASLARYGRSPLEWSRTVHTELIEKLNAAGARVIVFDVLFVDPTEDDAELAAAMQDAGNVIEPVEGQNTEINRSTSPGKLITYDRFAYPFSELADSASLIGHANIIPAKDGQIRQVPLVIMDGDTPIPALGLAAYLQYLRFPVDLVEIGPRSVSFANRTLATDSNRRMLIYYFGPPSKPYQPSTHPVYSLVDVMDDKVPPEAFADQIVLIGGLDAAALPDSYATPASKTGEKMFGVEIHANIIETIHQSLDTVPGVPHRVVVNMALGPLKITTLRGDIKLPLTAQTITDATYNTVALALIMGVLLSFLRWYIGLPVVLITYWIYYYWAVFKFKTDGIILELLFPGLALGFTFIGVLIVIYVFEERRRGQINDLFSRYVSAEIAQKIVEAFDRGQLELGGEEREITVLFADIRGFTTLSEGLTPPEVVAMLNTFLEGMTTIVMKHGGAINKYIGDNLMAFWNAPYPQADHAWNATQAGLEILAAIEYINERGNFNPPVQFGIGINTGPVVVGNIGSAQRLEYTPIGDTVNVASRLCGVAAGGSCLVGKRTWELIDDRCLAIGTHHIKVKGKTEELEVYELRWGQSHLTGESADAETANAEGN